MPGTTPPSPPTTPTGRWLSVTQAGGTGATVTPRTTYFGHDSDNNQTTVKDARGYTTTTAYNADDKSTLVTDPDGDSTLTCYDGDGNTAQTVPAVGVAASSLTPASCPTSYPSGYSTRLASDATASTFNALGEQIQQTTPAPVGQSGYETTTFTYDGNGNRIQTTAPATTNGGPSQVTVDTYNNADVAGIGNDWVRYISSLDDYLLLRPGREQDCRRSA